MDTDQYPAIPDKTFDRLYKLLREADLLKSTRFVISAYLFIISLTFAVLPIPVLMADFDSNLLCSCLVALMSLALIGRKILIFYKESRKAKNTIRRYLRFISKFDHSYCDKVLFIFKGHGIRLYFDK